MKFKLNEDFSPSMPKWLKNYILYNTMRRSKQAFSGKRFVNNPKYSSADYSNLRGARNNDIGRDDPSLLAINILNSLNIDYEKANFNEVTPVPSFKSPLFSDPSKLCISYLKSKYDSTIWIKDKSAPHEKFTFDDGKTIALQNINNKQYQSVVQGFCWLDLNDPNNFKTNIQQDRVKSKEGSLERNLKQAKAAESRYKNWQDKWINKFDKSGYLYIPLTKRYSDLLKKRNQSKLAQTIESTRDLLISTKNDLGNAILQGLDIDKDNSSAFSSATRYLSNAISEFKSALNELDNLNVPGADYSRIIKRFNSRLVDCLAYINYTKEYIDQFIPKSIDDIEIEISDDDWSEFE